MQPPPFFSVYAITRMTSYGEQMDHEDDGGTSDLSTSASDPEGDITETATAAAATSNNHEISKQVMHEDNTAFQALPLKDEPIDSDPPSDPEQKTQPPTIGVVPVAMQMQMKMPLLMPMPVNTTRRSSTKDRHTKVKGRDRRI